MTNTDRSVTVVIPAYNEELSIEGVIQNLQEKLGEAGCMEAEIIVVDDGSKDRTAMLAGKAGARIVSHPHNVGYGQSLKDGVLAARHDTILITDADSTYSLDDVGKLLDAYFTNGFDMVVGARQGKHYGESPKKKILRYILRRLVEFTAGRSIPDINSGLRLFSRKDILPYFRYLCNTFSFTTSLTLAYMMMGMYVAYIPVEYHERRGKTKVRLFRDSLRTLQFIVEAILYYNPIKIFLVFSFVLIAIALIALSVSFFVKLTSLFLVGIGSILLAVLMFGLGLIAVLLKQVLHSVDGLKNHKEPFPTD